jgi:hypothetical protein
MGLSTTAASSSEGVSVWLPATAAPATQVQPVLPPPALPPPPPATTAYAFDLATASAAQAMLQLEQQVRLAAHAALHADAGAGVQSTARPQLGALAFTAPSTAAASRGNSAPTSHPDAAMLLQPPMPTTLDGIAGTAGAATSGTAAAPLPVAWMPAAGASWPAGWLAPTGAAATTQGTAATHPTAAGPGSAFPQATAANLPPSGGGREAGGAAAAPAGDNDAVDVTQWMALDDDEPRGSRESGGGAGGTVPSGGRAAPLSLPAAVPTVVAATTARIRVRMRVAGTCAPPAAASAGGADAPATSCAPTLPTLPSRFGEVSLASPSVRQLMRAGSAGSDAQAGAPLPAAAAAPARALPHDAAQ